MLVYQVRLLLAVERFIGGIRGVDRCSTLVERAERAEEAHNLRLAKNSWEHLKIGAEARKTVEVHQSTVE